MSRAPECLHYEESWACTARRREGSRKTLQQVAFRYLKEPRGKMGKDRQGHFIRECSDKTRANGFKLKRSRFRLNVRTKFFTVNAKALE